MLEYILIPNAAIFFRWQVDLNTLPVLLKLVEIIVGDR